jgi:hypothetical protein
MLLDKWIRKILKDCVQVPTRPNTGRRNIRAEAALLYIISGAVPACLEHGNKNF